MNTGYDRNPVKQGFAAGTTFAAAALLLTVSILAVFSGISALAADELFVAGPEYIYQFDVTTWGWVVLILGVLGVVIAIGMFAGAVWARVAAIVIAALSIVANFLWLPYYPWWSIVVIAVDIVVIWAVATWRVD
ncbi:hypothetical protein AB0H71_04590 [Nocardia sp. NPDC050697]|uniref:DUF7144 family membrane protein n=1 Tax=Nocardia sp. NPDC050697 TaxID=3155158 RepID=UPI0033EEDD58